MELATCSRSHMESDLLKIETYADLVVDVLGTEGGDKADALIFMLSDVCMIARKWRLELDQVKS